MYSLVMPTTIRLPGDLEKRLDALAKRTGRPKAFYIREAIAGHLADLEDAYLADRVLAEVRAGRMPTYTLEESEESLGPGRHVGVRLPPELAQALEQASRATGKKRSEILRLALRAWLELPGSPGARPADRPADRVGDLIGSLKSGIPDLAEAHRAYIIESLKRGP